MAVNLLSYDHADDEYIDMEVSSFSNLFCHSVNSPREFEFQMSSASLEKERTTSPADELFYKGKLLPLHLPPRLQMVEKLLENSNVSTFDYSRRDDFEEFYGTPLMATAVPTPTATSTPFESCNISPSESCYVSRELNPEEYFFEYANEDMSGDNPKKSWTKKLKMIKQSSFGSKLKASRSYLKSLFGKSGCSDDHSCTAAAKVADEGTVSQAKASLNKHAKAAKKLTTPFGQIQKDKYQMSSSAATRNGNKQKINEDGSARLHRRSFSMAIKRHSTNKSSSSSSSSSNSSNSNGFHGLPFLKRSTSVNSEMENPIQGAIAHCKQSQQLFHPTKPVTEVGFYSLSASRITSCEDQERAELSRG